MKTNKKLITGVSLCLFSLYTYATPPGSGSGSSSGTGSGSSDEIFGVTAKISQYLVQNIDANGDQTLDKYEVSELISEYLDGASQINQKETLAVVRTFEESDNEVINIKEKLNEITYRAQRNIHYF